MASPMMAVRTFACAECGTEARLTVHADKRDDPRTMDRFRLLAASVGWCIDFDGRAWCDVHHPKMREK